MVALAGKGDTFENDVLKLIFNATAISLLADNTATTPLTNLYVSLHTADPTEAGNQTSSECTYTGYARVAVARTAGGWTVTANSVSPVDAITFGTCTAGSETATYASVGTASTGTGKLLYGGSMSPTIVISSGVTPQLTTSTVISEG